MSSALHLALAVAVICACAYAGGVAAARLRQPRVIGEIAAGIALGPTLVGAIFPGLLDWLFPADIARQAQHACQARGHPLRLLRRDRVRAGALADPLEADRVARARQLRRSAAARDGARVPAVLAARRRRGGKDARSSSSSASRSASPRCPSSRRSSRTSACRRNRSDSWRSARPPSPTWPRGASSRWPRRKRAAANRPRRPSDSLFTAALAAGVLVVLRPLLRRGFAALPPAAVRIAYPVAGVALAVGLANLTDRIGVSILAGAFLAGIAVGAPPGASSRALEQVRGLNRVLLLPIFFVATGLLIDLGSAGSAHLILAGLLVLAVGTVGKVGGVSLVAQARRPRVARLGRPRLPPQHEGPDRDRRAPDRLRPRPHLSRRARAC